MRYRNIGERRVWPSLIDQQTGRTLELEPGQEGELSGEVGDPYLELVGADERTAGIEGVEGAPGAATAGFRTGEAPGPDAGHSEDQAEDVAAAEPDAEAVRAQLIAEVDAEKAKLAADEATLAAGFEGHANL